MGLPENLEETFKISSLISSHSVGVPRVCGQTHLGYCSHAQNFFGEAEVPFLMLGIRRQGMDMVRGWNKYFCVGNYFKAALVMLNPVDVGNEAKKM